MKTTTCVGISDLPHSTVEENETVNFLQLHKGYVELSKLTPRDYPIAIRAGHFFTATGRQITHTFPYQLWGALSRTGRPR